MNDVTDWDEVPAELYPHTAGLYAGHPALTQAIRLLKTGQSVELTPDDAGDWQSKPIPVSIPPPCPNSSRRRLLALVALGVASLAWFGYGPWWQGWGVLVTFLLPAGAGIGLALVFEAGK